MATDVMILVLLAFMLVLPFWAAWTFTDETCKKNARMCAKDLSLLPVMKLSKVCRNALSIRNFCWDWHGVRM